MFKSTLILATFALAAVSSASQPISGTRSPPSNRLARREFKHYIPGIAGGAVGTFVGDKLFRKQQGWKKTLGVTASALVGSLTANHLYKKYKERRERKKSKGGPSSQNALPGTQAPIGV
ncbi:hypothetical protein IWQ61_002720 [Dispira simplex]|nr:hypothetical protein IWQ61_002720 [Dispira simplex]